MESARVSVSPVDRTPEFGDVVPGASETAAEGQCLNEELHGEEATTGETTIENTQGCYCSPDVHRWGR